MLPSKPGRERRRHQRGLALVLVLWVLTLMALMAAGFLAETRTEVLATSNRIEAARAEALADGAVYWAVWRLLRDDAAGFGRAGEDRPPPLPRDGRIVPWEAPGGAVRLSVRDEMGKVDLNAVSGDMLARLLHAVGLSPADSEVLAARIVDFRDPDSFRSIDGAEDDDYAAAGLLYGAKDASFDSIEELGQVPGLGIDLMGRVLPHVTIASGVPGIAPEFASRAALLAQPEMRAALVDDYILARASTPPGEAPPPPPPGPNYVRSTQTRYTIVAEARTDDGAIFVREARVRLDRIRPDRPFQVMAWSQRMTPLPAEDPNVAAVREVAEEARRL